MIRGKIETEREILPRRVVFGMSPLKKIHKKWVNTKNPNSEVKETNLRELLESAGYSFNNTQPASGDK